MREQQRKVAYILRHAGDYHERDGACSWTTYKALAHKGNARSVSISPHTWLKELTRTIDIERYEIRRTARMTTCGLCVIQGHFGRCGTGPRKGYAKEL